MVCRLTRPGFCGRASAGVIAVRDLAHALASNARHRSVFQKKTSRRFKQADAGGACRKHGAACSKSLRSRLVMAGVFAVVSTAPGRPQGVGDRLHGWLTAGGSKNNWVLYAKEAEPGFSTRDGVLLGRQKWLYVGGGAFWPAHFGEVRFQKPATDLGKEGSGQFGDVPSTLSRASFGRASRRRVGVLLPPEPHRLKRCWAWPGAARGFSRFVGANVVRRLDQREARGRGLGGSSKKKKLARRWAGGGLARSISSPPQSWPNGSPATQPACRGENSRPAFVGAVAWFDSGKRR